MSNIIHVQVFPGDLPVLRILAYAKQEARIAELEAALRDISRRMSKDEALFLVERYGYARREGQHQGKKSAEWMAEIDRAIDACVAEALAQEWAVLDGPEFDYGKLTPVQQDLYTVGFNNGSKAAWEEE